MTWETLDPGTGGAGSPYDSYLSQGYFSVRYRPFSAVRFNRVTSLTLHLESYGASGASPLKVALWDQQEGVWVEVNNVSWGDTLIQAPGRFIGGDGHIDARVESTGPQSSVSIESVDFTMVVER